MSRITAPAALLSKALGAATPAPSFRAATIASKYADLLHNARPRDPSETRTLTTTQNPLRRPVSATPAHPSSAPVDAAVLPPPPALPSLFASASAVDSVRVPILLDASGTAYASAAPSSAAILAAGTTIVAANPANVEPSSILTTVSHMGGVDGVELRWTHSREQAQVGGMLKNIWNGLIGGLQSQPQPAVN